MKLNKKGFISVTVVYTFFIVFLLLLVLVATTYINNRLRLTSYKNNIRTKHVNPTSMVEFSSLVETVIFLEGKDLENASGEKYKVISDKGYRFIGKNPNNYVKFNGETWRIIGVFYEKYDSDGDNVPDEIAPLVKIVRDESIGSYPFDVKNNVGSSTSRWGSPIWGDSQLMYMLNTKEFVNTAYKKDDTPVYNYSVTNWGNNVMTADEVIIYRDPGAYLDNHDEGNGKGYALVPTITDEENYEYEGTYIPIIHTNKDMIATVKWYLSDLYIEADNEEDYPDITLDINTLYNVERSLGENIFYPKGYIKTIANEDDPVYWYGKVAPIYASDYGFATMGSSDNTMQRSDCLNLNFYDWYDTTCQNTDWLHYRNTASGYRKDDNTNYTLGVVYGYIVAYTESGQLYDDYSPSEYLSLKPSLYLKPTVKVTSGEGTYLHPYSLYFEE